VTECEDYVGRLEELGECPTTDAQYIAALTDIAESGTTTELCE